MVTTTLLQEFNVSYSYSVHFTEGTFALSNALLRDLVRMGRGNKPGFQSKIAFVVEETIARMHPTLRGNIEEYCHSLLPSALSTHGIIEIPGGEYCKNTPAILQRLYDFLHAEQICRHSYVVAIGGGAFLDAVGYAAATTHRGLRLIRMPTTVLAQNDAGIGVKNSVNAFGKKNFIGTFAPAYAIINDSSFLPSLPERDWIAGTAEAVKVALIRDAHLFDFLEQNANHLLSRDMPVMQELIQRCAQLHMDHITKGGDPFELGSSRPLDFGHWSAHKIEALAHHVIRHGEAVAIGIELDAAYSYLSGYLREDDFRRITSLFDTLGFSEWREHLTLLMPNGYLSTALNEFKEHLGGVLHITLLSSIGKAIDVHVIDEEKMLEAIDLVTSLPRSRMRQDTSRSLLRDSCVTVS
jgi:3-dehydroquinate synthase